MRIMPLNKLPSGQNYGLKEGLAKGKYFKQLGCHLNALSLLLPSLHQMQIVSNGVMVCN